jgi:hypothetical protein
VPRLADFTVSRKRYLTGGGVPSTTFRVRLTALKAVNRGLRLNETDIKGVVGADIDESNKAMCVWKHIY